MGDDSDKTHYILDSRSVVGNCALWWGPDNSGYVCCLDDAGLYSEADARSHRDTDVPVPRELADSIAGRHVRLDRLREHVAVPRRYEPELAVDLDMALGCDPFDGDRGSPGDRTLRDEVVTARRSHECHGRGCFRLIGKGDKHRVLVEKTDGEVHQYHWCEACCISLIEGVA